MRHAPGTGEAELIVEDNGTGAIRETDDTRHGTELVRRLAERLGGTARVRGDRGTRWEIRFSV